jgi:hypothetical protein
MPAAVPSLADRRARPDLEAAALAARDEFDARDEAVDHAASLLDASWPDVAAEYAEDSEDARRSDGDSGGFGLETTTPHRSDTHDWHLVSAGRVELQGTRGLVLPIVLADADGRELRLRVALSLDLLLED